MPPGPDTRVKITEAYAKHVARDAYLTRTAVAKSNILVNAPRQAKYFYQDLDRDGGRLNGSKRYAVTFAKDQTPPVHGFRSLTLYSQYHFFVPTRSSATRSTSGGRTSVPTGWAPVSWNHGVRWGL